MPETVVERPPRQQRRAKVIKPAAGVKAMVSTSVGRVIREKVEVVELAAPFGLGVHLLQGNHVRLRAVHQCRHLHQVAAYRLFAQ